MFKVFCLWLLHVSVATAAPIILRTEMYSGYNLYSLYYSLCQPDYDSNYLHYDCVEPLIINIIQPIVIVSQIIVVIPTPTADSNEQMNEKNVEDASPVKITTPSAVIITTTSCVSTTTASPVNITASPASITTDSPVNTRSPFRAWLDSFSTKNIVMSNNTMKFTSRLTQTMDGENHST